MKKHRIRLHKRTLHLLGDPKYVQILVNPTTATIAFRSSVALDYRAEKIKWTLVGGKQCCEFYSKYLLNSLRDVGLERKDDHCYLVEGQLVATERLVKFCMADSILLDDNIGQEVLHE